MRHSITSVTYFENNSLSKRMQIRNFQMSIHINGASLGELSVVLTVRVNYRELAYREFQ